ncbi:MAG: hypothetical protein ACXWDL_15715 [Nocardioides sp.]
MRECLARERATGIGPGRYQLLAAISAVHTDAPDARDTDRGQISVLYDQLVVIDRSPSVRLNRAVAVAELDGRPLRQPGRAGVAGASPRFAGRRGGLRVDIA